MVKFQTLFGKFMIFGLLIFAIFSFITYFQVENNVDQNILGDSLVYGSLMNDTYGSLVQDLGSYTDQAQSQKDIFEKENPISGFGSILLFSIVSSGKVFNGMIIGTFNSLIKLPVIVFGVDDVVISVLNTILIVIIIISLWLLYRLGG